MASGTRSRKDRGSSTGHEAGRESRTQRWMPVLLMLMGVYERRGCERATGRPSETADPPPAFASAPLITGSMGR